VAEVLWVECAVQQEEIPQKILNRETISNVRSVRANNKIAGMPLGSEHINYRTAALHKSKLQMVLQILLLYI
jgi:hypothetical protein